MKILFVTASLNSGGSERVMSLLANAFAEKEWEVEIVCLGKPIVFYHLLPNVKVIFSPNKNGFLGLLSKVIWLRKYCVWSSPNIIISFMTLVYCITLFATIGKSFPVITSERYDPRYSSLKEKILRTLLLPRTNYHVVQTEHIRNYYPSFIRKKTSIIYNPVNDEVFHQIENGELKIENSERLNRIISVGRLTEQKNQQMMIRAFAKIAKQFPDWQLVIYGEGPLRKSLESIVESLDLNGRVLLPGRTDHVIEELRKSKIFCLSSDYEGMSNAMIEAVCIGLPIVTTNVSGVSELVDDGKGGYVVPCGDVDILAQTLLKMMGDADLRKIMSESNFNKASIFKLENIVEQWETLINGVICRYR